MKTWILAQVNGKRTLALFIVAHVVFASMWVFTIPKLHALTDQQQIFDVQPKGYDLTYAKRLIHALGGEGQNIYLNQQLVLDLFYPILYALSYSFLFLYLLKRMHLSTSWYLLPAVLPWLAAVFDYAENWYIQVMLLRPMELTEGFVATSSRLTVLKSSTTTVFFLLLVMFLVVHLVRYSRKRKLAIEEK